MSFVMTVSPDFSPEKISGWYILNTWLQRTLGIAMHMEMFDSFDQQRAAIQADKIDLIYANPYDAAMLVREKGFVAVAKPKGLVDEAVVAVAANSPVQAVEGLSAGIRVASTADPDIKMMGMILLEPADLDASKVTEQVCQTYVLVAKQLMSGQADVGIFPARAYDGLSGMVRASLKPLVRSEISVVQHVLLAGPKMAGQLDTLKSSLLGMRGDEKSARILEDLGLVDWEACAQEDVEFMIDLMDTLTS